MLFRLVKQFYTIKRLIETAKLLKEPPFYHVQTKQQVSPFSFFRYLFYHKGKFNPLELQSVIEHEKVHAREFHSVDILLMELILAFLWFNPFIWFYRNSLKQNLEFLADAQSCGNGMEKKAYQYLMLKHAIGSNDLFIVNSFYNSLIKKRIVMLNQSQSKNTNMLKMGLIIPALALFFVSFNTKTKIVYSPDNPQISSPQIDNNSIKLTIDKDTSDEELEKIKKNLIQDGIDFSYTVVRNDEKEIVDITLHLSGKASDGEKFSGNYNSGSNGPIKAISIFYDGATKTISFGNSKDHGKHQGLRNDNETKNDVVEIKTKTTADTKIKARNINQSSKNHSQLEEKTSKISRVESSTGVSSSNQTKELVSQDDLASIQLILLNGSEISYKDFIELNPEDITSISVYKKPFMTSIYGEKSKNGYISVSTLKGRTALGRPVYGLNTVGNQN
ncbi:M56 family metallopeptidase [Flagellimonas sp.]|uniref:M56 family metallopeptidase n=1 Tax=Flagellimonas sp. TaxID=2058762 RepID=UPI003B524013